MNFIKPGTSFAQNIGTAVPSKDGVLIRNNEFISYST
jgi:hypothetical protein